ncbi:MAG: hypothetical protein Q8O90_10630, partial [Elusimicrobiota bacterium]|nr:hypothetical protein [Elusimicrobiota bacterium]
MKLKHIILLLTAFIPAYLLLAPKTAPVPSDLRDAVSDGVYEGLAGSASGPAAPEVPLPAQETRGSADKSIYGSDDRLDYYEGDAGMKELADSVVSLW